jgi:hypothetical protein
VGGWTIGDKQAAARDSETQKPQTSLSRAGASICNLSGDVLLSHTLARAVPSGLKGLTSVFGMGTGGTLSL